MDHLYHGKLLNNQRYNPQTNHQQTCLAPLPAAQATRSHIAPSSAARWSLGSMSTVKDGEIGMDSGDYKKKTAALPSGNLLQFAIEHGPFSSLIYLLKMVISHFFCMFARG